MLDKTQRNRKRASKIIKQTKVDVLMTMKNEEWTWGGDVTRGTDARWTTKVTVWQSLNCGSGQIEEGGGN